MKKELLEVKNILKQEEGDMSKQITIKPLIIETTATDESETDSAEN